MEGDNKLGNYQGNWRETVPNLNTSHVMAARVNETANNARQRANNARQRVPSAEELIENRDRLLNMWSQEYFTSHEDDVSVDGFLDYVSDKINNQADDNNVAEWESVIKNFTDDDGFKMMFGGRKNRFKTYYYKKYRRKQTKKKRTKRKQTKRKQTKRK